MLKQNKFKDPAKQFLIRARTITQEIAMARMEVERCQNRGLTVAYSPQEKGKNNGARTNGTEIAFVSAAEISGKVEELFNRLVRVKFEIDETINNVVDGRLRLLLKYRYVNCAGWKEVADVLGCSEDHTRGILHKDALNAVRELIKITQNNTK